MVVFAFRAGVMTVFLVAAISLCARADTVSSPPCDSQTIANVHGLITGSRSYLSAGRLDDAINSARRAKMLCPAYIPAGIHLASLYRRYGDVGLSVETLETLRFGYPVEDRAHVVNHIMSIHDSFARMTLEVLGRGGLLEQYEVSLELSASALTEEEQKVLRVAEQTITHTPQLPQEVASVFLPPGRLTARVWTRDPRFPGDGIAIDDERGVLIGQDAWMATAGRVYSVRLRYDQSREPWWLVALLLGFGGLMFR